MTTLTSKIDGVQLWTYDIPRRPNKTLDAKGNPKLLSYTDTNKQGDGLLPVTQHPTEDVNQAVNHFIVIFDVNHISNGNPIVTHGIQWTTGANIDQQIQMKNYLSLMTFSNAMFVGDDVYIQAPPTTTVTNNQSKNAFTTKTPGIKIIDQTGIVQSNRGYGIVIFEVEPGYKITVGNTIKANNTIINENTGGLKAGTPETYSVLTEIVPGIYEMTLTAGNDDWELCDIDFATIQDPTTAPTPTTPHSKVTFDLSHCTVTPNETTVKNGVHSWTFTADEGYIFDKTGGIMNVNTGEAGNQIPATNTNVTYLNNYDVQFDTTIMLTANVQQVATIPYVQTLTNVRSNVTSDSISRNLNAISLTADSGYIFKTSVQILFYSGGKVVSEYNVDGNNTDSITIPLNTTKENTITSTMDKVQLTASAILATSKVGYEHNYLISDTELNSFSKEQIWSYSAKGEDLYDVTEYINNLIELPFNVDTTTTVNNISVGRVKSNVVSHETKERFVALDLGTIKVPARYNNAYDYQNKSIKLFAPFVPPITINNENAIEKTINISYKIDISNGDATINLSNDNVLFYTGTNNIASQLPFLNTLKNTVINRDTHFNDSGIRQPYIVVTRETPILNSAYYPTNERGLIKSYNGNVKVSLLNNMNIPNNELSALTSQLESGVKYVKSN